MPGDRVTTARLRADASQFIAELNKAAAAARAFDKSLNGGSTTLGGMEDRLDDVGTQAHGAADGIDELGESADNTGASIGRLDTALHEAGRSSQVMTQATLAQHDADLSAAKAKQTHATALHNLTLAERAHGDAIGSGNIVDQAATLDRLKTAQIDAQRASRALGDAYGEQSAQALAAEDAQNKLNTAVTNHKVAVLKLADAEKALEKASESDDASESSIERAMLRVEQAENAVEKSGIAMAQSQDKAATAAKHLAESQDKVADSSAAAGDSVAQASAATREYKRDLDGLTNTQLAYVKSQDKVTKATDNHKRAVFDLGLAEKRYGDASSTGDIDGTRAALLDLDAAQSKAQSSATDLAIANRELDDSWDGGNDERHRGLLDGIGDTGDRIGMIIQAATAFGPAIVPMFGMVATGAVAVGAELTTVAAAGATAVLAFQGLGDGMKAWSELSAAPTIENLAATKEAFKELGPAGVGFVKFLSAEAAPALEHFQQLAGKSLFPELETAMRSLSTLGPEAGRIITTMGDAMGRMAIDGAKALAGDEWTDFFDYLATKGGTVLQEFGEALGNTAKGLGNLIVAFDPLTETFSEGFVSMTADFAGWADNLGATDGFANFVNYIQEMGPRVLDTLGDISMAFVDMGKAMAPMTGISLDAISGLFNGISMVMNSGAGSALMAAAVGFGALSTAMRVGKWVGASAIVKTIGSVVTGANALGTGAVLGAATTKLDKLKTSLGGWGGIAMKAGGAGLLMAGMNDSFKDVSTTLSGTGMAMMMGVTNPIALGAIAIAGAAVDAAKGNNAMMDSIAQGTALLQEQPMAFAELDAAAAQSTANVEAFANKYEDSMLTAVFTPTGVKNMFEDVVGKSDVEEGAEANDRYIDSLNAMKGTVVMLGASMSTTGRVGFEDMDLSTKNLMESGQAILPVLEQMGTTVEHVQTLSENVSNAENDFGIDSGQYRVAAQDLEIFAQRFDRTAAMMDTDAFKEIALGDALAGLNDEMLTVADSATALSQALATLVMPDLANDQSMDDWNNSLKNMDDILANRENADGSINALSRSLKGQSDAAYTNRSAVRSLVGQYVDMIGRSAAAGAGSKQLTRRIGEQREHLIRAGVAAGLNEGHLRRLISQYHLTPRLVQTLFKQMGISEAENKARNLAQSYNGLPKEVRIWVREHGIPETKADIESLKKAFPKLSEAQIRIIANMDDNAGVKLDGITAKVKKIDGDKATVKIDADTAAFDKAWRQVQDKQTGAVSAKGLQGPDGDYKPDFGETEQKTIKVKIVVEGKKNLDAEIKGITKGKHEVKVQVKVEDKGVGKDIKALTGDGGKGSKIKIGVELNAKGVASEIGDIKQAIGKLDSGKTTVKVDANTNGATGDIKKVTTALHKVDGIKTNPKIDAQPQQALTACKQVTTAMHKVDGLKATPTVTANVGQALSAIGSVISAMGRVQSKSVTITTNHVSTGGKARGGPIYGPGGPREDLIPAMLSNGEFVVNAAATSRNFQQLVDINNSAFADGGPVGFAKGGKAERRRKRDQRTLTPGSDLKPMELFAKILRGDVVPTLKDVARLFRDMRDEAKDVVKAEHALRRARRGSKASTHAVTKTEKLLEKARGKEKKDKEDINRLEKRLKQQRDAAKDDNKRQAKLEKDLEKQRNQLAKATDKWKAAQQELIDQAKTISAAITSNGAIFGGSGTSVTAAGILAKLRGASKDAAQFNKDIRTLRSRGLDEDLIGQLLEQGSTPEGVAAVHSLATASKRMLSRINKQQARLERIGASVGTWGVNAGGGPKQQTVNVNMNGPIHTTDVDRLAKLLPAHIRKALRMAGQP